MRIKDKELVDIAHRIFERSDQNDKDFDRMEKILKKMKLKGFGGKLLR